MSQRKAMRTARRLIGSALLFGASAPIMAASTFVLVINDGPDEGFNDTTPATPVTGNPGTTLGQQRINVFEAAMQVWADTLDSNVDIRVDAQFDPQFCDATSATLGSAGVKTVHGNFANAPALNTWYGQALGNSIAGADLSGDDDINATFNSNLDLGNPDCIGGFGWDYRIPSAGTPLSLYSVVLHELGHGLNFQTFTNLSTGEFLSGFPDIYATFLFDQGTDLAWTDMANGQRAASAIGGNLFWLGANAKIAGIGVPLTAGSDPVTQIPEMYAPNPLEGGSSVSHWDEGLNPDELMEPVSTANPLRETTIGSFVDMGWSVEFDEFYGCGVDYAIDTDWHQIGLPCVPATATVRAVFGDDLGEEDYIDRWAVWGWDTASYFQLGIDDAMSQGTAYWIRTVDGGTIDIDGTATPLSTASPCTDTLNGCFAVDIGTADVFHMVAHALPYSVDWRDGRFVSGSDAKTPSEAQAAGWAENVFYRYNGSNYDTHDDTVSPATLDSHDGAWVRTLPGAPADLQLLFPAGGTNTLFPPAVLAAEGASAGNLQTEFSAVGSVPTGRRGRRPVKEWSVHITAAADGMTAANNLLGWHAESRRGYDTRDLPERLPFSEPYLTLVFPHPEWPGDKGGDYTTDFHRSRRKRGRDSWTLDVRSDDLTRMVTLTWDGPEAVLERSTLVDEATGAEIPATQLSYQFELLDQTRRFRWRYKPQR